MKKIVTMIMFGFLLLLCQQMNARTLTVYNMNGWGEQGAVEVIQKNVQGATRLGQVAGAPLYDDPKIEQGSWTVPNEAFTLQLQFTKPRASLNVTVEKSNQNVAIEVGPNGAKRV